MVQSVEYKVPPLRPRNPKLTVIAYPRTFWGENVMKLRILKRLIDDTRGIAAIEYGLIAVIVAVGLMGSFLSIGDDVEDHYDDVGTQYEQANAV